MAEDKMIGWHHQLDVREFEQVPGVGEGHGSLACCSLWGCDMTEPLNGLTDYLQCQEEHRLQFLFFCDLQATLPLSLLCSKAYHLMLFPFTICVTPCFLQVFHCLSYNSHAHYTSEAYFHG